MTTAEAMRSANGRAIADVLALAAFHASDERGSFAKVLGADPRCSMLEVAEVFWSRSERNVIRGMHLQVPPDAGSKLVWVVEGAITDVILDLRPGSGTRGEWNSWDLSSGSGALLIPEGCAHGFEVHSEVAIVCYAQSSHYSSESDTGVRWDSFGYPWTCDSPQVSARDSALPSLASFSWLSGGDQ